MRSRRWLRAPSMAENPQSVFAAAKLYTVGQKFVTTGAMWPIR